MVTPGPIQLSSPTDSGPYRTTWGPTTFPWPRCTPGPTTAAGWISFMLDPSVAVADVGPCRARRSDPGRRGAHHRDHRQDGEQPRERPARHQEGGQVRHQRHEGDGVPGHDGEVEPERHRVGET